MDTAAKIIGRRVAWSMGIFLLLSVTTTLLALLEVRASWIVMSGTVTVLALIHLLTQIELRERACGSRPMHNREILETVVAWVGAAASSAMVTCLVYVLSAGETDRTGTVATVSIILVIVALLGYTIIKRSTGAKSRSG